MAIGVGWNSIVVILLSYLRIVGEASKNEAVHTGEQKMSFTIIIVERKRTYGYELRVTLHHCISPSLCLVIVLSDCI